MSNSHTEPCKNLTSWVVRDSRPTPAGSHPSQLRHQHRNMSGLISVDGYAANHYGLPLGLPLFDSGLRRSQAMSGNLILHQATACDGARSTGPLCAVPGSHGMEHGGASTGAVFGGSLAERKCRASFPEQWTDTRSPPPPTCRSQPGEELGHAVAQEGDSLPPKVAGQEQANRQVPDTVSRTESRAELDPGPFDEPWPASRSQ